MNLFLIVILIISELSLILAHVGHFSLSIVMPLTIIAGIVLFRVRPRTSNILIVLPILFIAGILFFQPYQYMDGGWDPGNYINTGVHVAKTGGVVYHDEMLKETSADINSDGTGIKYPGLYIKDVEKGLVVPQFFHLFPVWIAIFYKLFGLNAVFYVNPFFALLSIVLIFLIGKKAMGKEYGLLAAVLLGLNVIQIWGARFPVSETLAQFLVLTGFYFWMLYLDNNDSFYAFWAGVSLGEFLLVSVTSLLIIPVLVVYFLFRFKKKDLYFILPFLFLALHLFIQLFLYSSIYFGSVMLFFGRKEIHFAVILVLWVLSFIALVKISYKKNSWQGIALRLCAIIVLVFLFVYGYFIRPYLSKSVEAVNLVEFGNWLSFFALLIAAFGLIAVIYKSKDEGLLLFVVTALVVLIFFLYDKRMNSRYPFSLRRYIPVVIPAFCLCASYFFYFINGKFPLTLSSPRRGEGVRSTGEGLKNTGKFLSILIIPLLITVPIYKNKSFIEAKDHKNWLEFWSETAKHMDGDALYISNSYKWARPLSDVFGKKVIVFDGYPEFSGERICEFAEGYLKKGEPVFYISDSEKPYSLTVDFIETYSNEYKGEYIEDAPGFPPRVKKQDIRMRIFKICRIMPLSEKNYVVDVGDDSLGLLCGFDKARMFGGMDSPARWTFRRAEMVVPWFGDNVLQVLTIRAGGMSKDAGISKISLYVNDIPIVENYEITEQMREYKFNIPAKTIESNGSSRAILTIKSNTWSPKDYGIQGFPEDLGILLDWVGIERIK